MKTISLWASFFLTYLKWSKFNFFTLPFLNFFEQIFELDQKCVSGHELVLVANTLAIWQPCDDELLLWKN